MSKLKDSILGSGPQASFSEKKQDAKGMVDISLLNVGQNGIHTNFAGYVNNAAYVRKNIIAVLVQEPEGFKNLPNPTKWTATLKALVETLPNSIEGLNGTLTVENVEEAVGGAGEIQQTASNVVRERSVPVFNWTEKYGKPINAMLSGWITNLIMDPETKIPAIMSRRGGGQATNVLEGELPSDVLPNYNSMTVLFIEPDPTHTRVVEAWLSTNMRPTTAGEVIGSRDLTAGGELTQYSVEFTALTQMGQGVRDMAQKYMNQLNMVAINPNIEPAWVNDANLVEDGKVGPNGYSNSNVSGAEVGYADQTNVASGENVATSGSMTEQAEQPSSN